MQRNRKVWPMYRGKKKQSIKTVPEIALTLDLLIDKYFKSTFINMFKEPNEIISK